MYISQKRYMYGIFTYTYYKSKPDVGKCAIHGAYGCTLGCSPRRLSFFCVQGALETTAKAAVAVSGGITVYTAPLCSRS